MGNWHSLPPTGFCVVQLQQDQHSRQPISPAGCRLSEGLSPDTPNQAIRRLLMPRHWGSADPGLLDVISVLLDAGTISPTGELEQDFIITPAADSGSGEAIRLIPADVRELQLAKAAVAAGITILLKSAGIEEQTVDAVYLAGGFGNYIKKESAIRTGLLDSSYFEKIIPIGNASGTGALIALKSEDFDSRINKLLEKMEYIELSSDPDFVTEYAMKMYF